MGNQELGLCCVKKKWVNGIGDGRALERCVSWDKDYADLFLLLFVKEAGVANGGVKPICTCTVVEQVGTHNGIGDGRALKRSVSWDPDYAECFMKASYDGDRPSCSHGEEDDPHYMAFLANAKPHGKSFVCQGTDLNGLPLLLEYEKDRDLEFHPVEKEKYSANALMNRMNDGILSKKQPNEDRDLDNTMHRVAVKIVPDKEPRMVDGILSKKRRNEDRDLDNRKHRMDVKIVPDNEQRNQNGSKSMDVEVKIEPQEDCDAREEAISESEVEILENVGAGMVGKGSSFNPFVPSAQHCRNLRATIRDSGYRKECLNLLMRPYNEEEYTKLWKDIKMPTNERGKSLLSLHKAVNREIKSANHDKDKKLNIMRGFFFWLERLTRQDAFQPWEDAECLQTMPRSS